MSLSAPLPLVTPENKPSPQDLLSYRRKQIARGIFATGLALGGVGLCYVATAYDFKDPLNAVVTTCAGTVFGGAFHLLPYRKRLNEEDVNKRDITSLGRVINFTKDKIINYSATFFIVTTQIYLNVPQSRWLHRLIYGGFNGILGLQIAAMADSFSHPKLKDDETGTLLLGDQPRKVEMLSGNTSLSRRGIEVAKAVIGIATLVLGELYPPATFASKLGMILLGNVSGTAFHEVVHAAKKYYEKKEAASAPESESPFIPVGATYSRPYKLLIYIEKVEQVAGRFFPGFILAFNTKATDFFAGFFYGMLRQIDWIRITKTPYNKLDELQKRAEPDPHRVLTKVMTVAKWIFAIGAVGGFLLYEIYNGIVNGPLVNVFALTTVGIALYSSYLLTRYMDRQKLPSNRLYNTLFFLTNYSLSPPLLYYAINQVLRIGSTSLEDYGPYKIILSCLAYASLSSSFGEEAGRRATDRNVAYPAEVSPLTMLFTVFLTEQLTTKS